MKADESIGAYDALRIGGSESSSRHMALRIYQGYGPGHQVGVES